MTLKPGDLVRTPTGRVARVVELRADGRRELRYADTGESVALLERHLQIVAQCRIQAWHKHTL